MRSANAQFWGALRGLLLEAGLGDGPETLVFERSPVPARLEAEMLFSQTFGYPLETVFKDQALRLRTGLRRAWLRGCDAPRVLCRSGGFPGAAPRRPTRRRLSQIRVRTVMHCRDCG